MHVRFFSLVDFVDTVLEMSQTLDVNFVVDSVAQLSLVSRLAIDCLETDVLNIISKDL